MGTIKDKRILLGVTGGIAAYKAVEIVRRLKKAGAQVKVIMTRAAQEFVTELTFREISGEQVAVGMWDRVAEFRVEHIALANWADLLLVAPATANFLAKAAAGLADDMLTTTLLATKAPVFMAPAMNSNMYENLVTQENIERLKGRGVHIIEPATGELACGATGRGRLPEAAQIAALIENFFSAGQSLKGRKILVTAGGTIAPLDPVRFIGNRSSGKMGYALAEEAAARGAQTLLISGPTALNDPPGVKTVRVETTAEMYEVVLAEFDGAAAVLKAAAVADYAAKEVAPQKLKKKADHWTVELVRGTDILYELGRRKQPHQVLVGFAAETENLLAYAKEKLTKKNLDFIVANNVTEPGAGFQGDTNIAKLLFRDGRIEDCPLMEKRRLAEVILDRVESLLAE